MDHVIFAPNNPRAETIALTPSLDKILAHKDSIDDDPCRMQTTWHLELHSLDKGTDNSRVKT